MKLLNDFYEVLALEHVGDELRGRVKLNPNHFIYEVHFPGNPVTPGVCLLQMAMELLGEFLQKDVQLQTAVNIKFKRPVNTDIEPWFVFSFKENRDHQQLLCVSIENEEKQYAKMTLMVRMEEQEDEIVI
jgi:3-hydroxyacyl-[acyl-carrier-protein] dehydratase